MHRNDFSVLWYEVGEECLSVDASLMVQTSQDDAPVMSKLTYLSRVSSKKNGVLSRKGSLFEMPDW